MITGPRDLNSIRIFRSYLQMPPISLLQTEDDPVDTVNNSLVYYIALKETRVPVKMHLYAHGAHAIGLRRTKFPIKGWPQLTEA